MMPEADPVHWTDYATAFGTVGAVIVALILARRDAVHRRQDRRDEHELWARQVSIAADVTEPGTVEITFTNFGPSVVYNCMVRVFTDTGGDDPVEGAKMSIGHLSVGSGKGSVKLDWDHWTPVTNARIEFTDLYGNRWFRTQQGEFGRVSM